MPTVPPNPAYPIDYTGQLASNKVTGEQQILTAANYRDYHFIVPKLAPYFAESMKISHRSLTGVVRLLVEGVDYYCTHWFISASRACSKPIYGSISFLDQQLPGVVTLEYQTLGGMWTQDDAKIAEILADRLHNPRITAWDVVVNMPVSFPPVDHAWDLADMVGMSTVVTKLQDIAAAILTSQSSAMTTHMNNINNVHQVTAAQVGTYTSAQIDAKINAVNARIDAL